MNARCFFGQGLAIGAGLLMWGTAVSGGNLPLPRSQAKTPETRTLTAQEASLALERDWLFQAGGEPLLERTAKEIRWTRDLAGRLTQGRPAQDFAADLAELGKLERQWSDLRAKPAVVPSPARPDAAPA